MSEPSHDATAPATPARGDASNPVEEVKGDSCYLRGTIREELLHDADHFDKAASQLLKFHGTYQQDDRDHRAEARSAGDGKAYMFMVRTRIPGGQLTARQLLAEIDLGDELGNQTLRITSRQGLQLHGIRKCHLQETIRRIHEVQLTTLGACGDVNRNVMCCPAPYANPLYREIQQLAALIAGHFASRSGAYHEIWLQEWEGNQPQGEKIPWAGQDEFTVEPIYGRHYLPRKFKIGIALPHDNCIDVYTHDVGLIAVPDGDRVAGYNVLVGGGMGVTPSAKKTFPAVGKKLAYVPTDQILDVLTAIVKVQRDFGNRGDRKVARLKYLIANWGIPLFRAKVEEYLGAELREATGVDVTAFDDHMGWAEQGDGRWFYGLNVENGRIQDSAGRRLKSALREICRELQPGIRLTSHQSILFSDIAAEHRPRLESMLRDHGVPLSHEISQVRRWSMACVAWPTCGLSITEAERALPGIVDQLEVELERLGLSSEEFTVRMTGCPNGCARPY
ncbi:MAG TPA: NADPH-dependent assimilatory sulfite reductase hemoprotein subunit, partial [Pirellulaceae bacterium]